jgi:hypothetical protein
MTKIMKWVSITMLLLALLQLSVASHPVLVSIVVCASGLLVTAQAIRPIDNKPFATAKSL